MLRQWNLLLWWKKEILSFWLNSESSPINRSWTTSKSCWKRERRKRKRRKRRKEGKRKRNDVLVSLWHQLLSKIWSIIAQNDLIYCFATLPTRFCGMLLMFFLNCQLLRLPLSLLSFQILFLPLFLFNLCA
jgi:hypothetical protein